MRTEKNRFAFIRIKMNKFMESTALSREEVWTGGRGGGGREEGSEWRKNEKKQIQADEAGRK